MHCGFIPANTFIMADLAEPVTHGRGYISASIPTPRALPPPPRSPTPYPSCRALARSSRPSICLARSTPISYELSPTLFRPVCRWLRLFLARANCAGPLHLFFIRSFHLTLSETHPAFQQTSLSMTFQLFRSAALVRRWRAFDRNKTPDNYSSAEA